MKLTLISDTHGMHRNSVPESGDVLIHAGDCLQRGTVPDLVEFMNWMSDLEYNTKILVAGNHDHAIAQNPEFTRSLAAKAGVSYLCDSAIEVADRDSDEPRMLKFWGSPWTPDFHPETWVFNQPRGPKSVERWAKIPDDTEVLITHGPPSGILDECPAHFYEPQTVHHVGCAALRDRIERLPLLRLHVFGHIHESHGVFLGRPVGCRTDAAFLNVSTLTEHYRPRATMYTEFEL